MVEEILKSCKSTESFSYTRTKNLISKAVELYSVKLAKLVREQRILEEIERSQREREEK